MPVDDEIMKIKYTYDFLKKHKKSDIYKDI